MRRISQTTPPTLAANDPRWAALRDRKQDRSFVYAVKTTGIYCNPDCPSRRPLPTNVTFYDSEAAAERAGYRPCKRCQPQLVEAGSRQADTGNPRTNRFDWDTIGADLDAYGCSVVCKLLTTAQCRDIAALYPRDDYFRSHVLMARHGFGKGEYKYFCYPLPGLIGELRMTLYSHLAPIANRWNERIGAGARYPERHADFLELCRAAGQVRPTPLLLQYGAGDFNCLHQDRYGDLVFPLQATILLSEPGRDFTGGEFVLTEQRPRMQGRAEVVPLRQGDAVLFAVHDRPVKGSRGSYRVNLRHGVSRIRSGRRHTLGIIFHDAK